MPLSWDDESPGTLCDFAHAQLSLHDRFRAHPRASCADVLASLAWTSVTHVPTSPALKIAEEFDLADGTLRLSRGCFVPLGPDANRHQVWHEVWREVAVGKDSGSRTSLGSIIGLLTLKVALPFLWVNSGWCWVLCNSFNCDKLRLEISALIVSETPILHNGHRQ